MKDSLSAADLELLARVVAKAHQVQLHSIEPAQRDAPYTHMVAFISAKPAFCCCAVSVVEPAGVALHGLVAAAEALQRDTLVPVPIARVVL